MIRIDDHLFRPDIISHMQIVTDGHSYALTVEYGDKEAVLSMFDRSAAELALEKAQQDIIDFIAPWDEGEEEEVL